MREAGPMTALVGEGADVDGVREERPALPTEQIDLRGL